MKLSVFFEITDKLANSNNQATITLKSGKTITFTPATTDIYAIEEECSKGNECIPTPSVIVLEEGVNQRITYIEVEEIAMLTI